MIESQRLYSARMTAQHQRTLSTMTASGKSCQILSENSAALQCHLGDMEEQEVAGWPTGPLACCAACWQPPPQGEQQHDLL